ncbi:hypothetical protein AC249_AIPGENE27847, partial [Exaiptasia diaphana]
PQTRFKGRTRPLFKACVGITQNGVSDEYIEYITCV